MFVGPCRCGWGLPARGCCFGVGLVLEGSCGGGGGGGGGRKSSSSWLLLDLASIAFRQGFRIASRSFSFYRLMGCVLWRIRRTFL